MLVRSWAEIMQETITLEAPLATNKCHNTYYYLVVNPSFQQQFQLMRLRKPQIRKAFINHDESVFNILILLEKVSCYCGNSNST